MANKDNNSPVNKNKGKSFSMKVVTKAKEEGMCRVEYTKIQAEDLRHNVFYGSQTNSTEDKDPRVHKEFTGLDGKKHIDDLSHEIDMRIIERMKKE